MSVHKASGLARVRLNGHDHYLGRAGSIEAQQNYDRKIAEWLAGGRFIAAPSQVITVARLVESFDHHAQTYYRRESGRTSEATNFTAACSPLLMLYSTLPADAFTAQQLKAVRQRMVDSGLCRNSINSRVRRIRHVFKWGVSESMVHPHVLESLRSLAPLKRGRSEAVESEAVKPVPEDHIARTCAVLNSEPLAIVETQLLTGMRPGEAVSMLEGQIDRSSQPWAYRPSRHKTAHHGHARTVFLNERAQEIVTARLTGNPESPVFRNKHGRAYTVETYRWEVAKAATRAGVPVWGPSRLRHNVATFLRKHFTLDVIATLLGHRKPDVTLIYAEPHMEAAKAAVGSLRMTG